METPAPKSSDAKVLEAKVLNIPVQTRGNPDATCSQYLVALAHLDTPIATSVVDVGEEAYIVNTKTLAVVVAGLNKIAQWLSYRQGVCDFLRLLCGRSRDERRAVSRGIKRVLEWRAIWEDLSTAPEEQLADPLSPFILFDKKIRRSHIKYITQYTNNDKNYRQVDIISAADVLLIALVTPWLRAFESHQSFLNSTIPSLLEYVRNNRRFLRDINTELFSNAVPGVLTGLEDTLSLFWIDDMDSAAPSLNYTFRFTCKDLMSRALKMEESEMSSKMAKSSMTSIVNTASSSLKNDAADAAEDKEVLAAMCTLLISRIDWPTTDDSAVNSPQACDGIETPVEVDKAVSTALVSDEIDYIDLDVSSQHFWDIMDLPKGREKRKREQIMSLVEAAEALLPHGGLAVEFCCGGGYVGIPLAVKRPDAMVILTDMNSVSLSFAKIRVKRLGLENVHFKLCELTQIERDLCEVGRSSLNVPLSERPFDVGIALHACGGASDTVLKICRDANASFVVSPCCYGFIKHAVLAGPEFMAMSRSDNDVSSEKERSSNYPLSAIFRKAGWKSLWFAQLCSQADRTFWTHDDRSVRHNTSGRLAMKVIDSDRLLKARENGFLVEAKFMSPFNASPKNHILVGAI